MPTLDDLIRQHLPNQSEAAIRLLLADPGFPYRALLAIRLVQLDAADPGEGSPPPGWPRRDGNWASVRDILLWAIAPDQHPLDGWPATTELESGSQPSIWHRLRAAITGFVPALWASTESE